MTHLKLTFHQVGLGLIMCLTACSSLPGPFGGATATPEIGALASDSGAAAADLPGLQAQATAAAHALKLTPPILLLTGLDDQQSRAQQLAIGDARFQANLLSADGQPLRNEIFGVYAARQSDLTDATARCALARCYRVEMYNYAINLASIAIVDVDDQQVLAVNHVADSQPDIPLHLKQLALDIATRAPEVVSALGYQPSADMAQMASTKTSLNATLCQRSHHLCVAPTFVKDGRALWAIVDLTAGTLAGVRWTTVGYVAGAVTERSLQNDVVTALYCDRATSLSRNGWTMNYILTSSDGLEVTAVRYNDKVVMDSAKLVDWHVSYSTQEGFGYSDAVGCPVFSQAAVVAFEGPTIEDIRVNEAVAGFALRQKFWSDLWPLPCNYYYEQRFEFYDDGRFRVVAGNDGRGCGDQGTYRPVLRMAFAGSNTFAAWDGSIWKDWTTEAYQLQSDGHATQDGFEYRLQTSSGQSFYVEPGRGQFGDGGRGDNAYVYLTRRHTDRAEGDDNMITIGPCCNTDYRQGPERFIDTPPEATAGQAIVLWYVPQMTIDSTAGQQYCWAESTLKNGVYVGKTYPCYSGPMFVPVK